MRPAFRPAVRALLGLVAVSLFVAVAVADPVAAAGIVPHASALAPSAPSLADGY